MDFDFFKFYVVVVKFNLEIKVFLVENLIFLSIIGIICMICLLFVNREKCFFCQRWFFEIVFVYVWVGDDDFFFFFVWKFIFVFIYDEDIYIGFCKIDGQRFVFIDDLLCNFNRGDGNCCFSWVVCIEYVGFWKMV